MAAPAARETTGVKSHGRNPVSKEVLDYGDGQKQRGKVW